MIFRSLESGLANDSVFIPDHRIKMAGWSRHVICVLAFEYAIEQATALCEKLNLVVILQIDHDHLDTLILMIQMIGEDLQ